MIAIILRLVGKWDFVRILLRKPGIQHLTIHLIISSMGTTTLSRISLRIEVPMHLLPVQAGNCG